MISNFSMISKAHFRCPLGIAEVEASETHLISLRFLDDTSEIVPITASLKENEVLNSCFKQLNDYFAGARRGFDLKLDPKGTPFQKKVWEELSNIPYGETISYTQLADRLSDRKAIRAVASANATNPIWVIIPCHRVIGSNGKLVGYAGGLWRKRWLIEHENRFSAKPVQGKLF
ncbi:MAG: methylated-DNA--[protein]-cysteine S-methyltransferase [Flammeovirgaceae bacterium]